MSSAILSPLKTVDSLFERHKENISGNDFIKTFEKDVHSALDRIVKDNYDQIPFLSAELYKQGRFRPHQLVRMRGIVQDVFDPEYFLGVYTSVDKDNGERHVMASHYRENIQLGQRMMLDEGEDGTVISERQPLLICPIPGENNWVKYFHKGRGEGSAMECMRGEDDSGSGSRKRAAADTNARRTVMRMETEAKLTTMTNMDTSMDNSSVTGESRQTNSPQTSVTTSFADAPPSLVKFYGGAGLKLNDTVELIGVLGPYENNSGGDVSAGTRGSDEVDFVLDESADLPPPSVMPRIHAISSRKLGGAYPLFLQVDDPPSGNDEWVVNSSVSASFFKDKIAKGPEAALTVASCGHDIQNVRAAVCGAITSVLTKHCQLEQSRAEFTAEYIMLAALSHVYGRQEDGSPLGSLSLNLVGCRDTAAADALLRDLELVLSSFVPRMIRLDVTLETLRSGAFHASKSYDTNRMHPSVLQTAPGTIFLVNEAGLQEGKLDASGVKSLEALKGVANKQRLSVHFEYFDMKVLVDTPVIVASCAASLVGGGGVTQIDVTSPASSHSSQAAHDQGQHSGVEELDEDLRIQARQWWAARRYLRCDLSPEVGKHLEDAFVSLRQTDPSLGAMELQSWIRLSHLIAVSYGSPSISVDHFNRAVDMETRRRKGILALTAKK